MRDTDPMGRCSQRGSQHSMGGRSPCQLHAMPDRWCCRIALLLVSVATVVSSVRANYEEHQDSPTLTLAQTNALNAAHLAHIAAEQDTDPNAHAVPGYELLLQAPCATGRMNANEDWISYRHKWTRDIVYRKKDQSFAQDHPPCAVFLMHVQEIKRRDPPPFDPALAIFDNTVGGYVAMELSTVHDSYLWQRETIPERHQPEEDETSWVGSTQSTTIEESGSREAFLRDSPFAFVSPLDAIEVVTRRSEYTHPSDVLVHNVLVLNMSALDTLFIASAPASSLVQYLLELEENVLALASPGSNAATWQAEFSHADWARLRRAVRTAHRNDLARDWTLLAKAVLVYEKNATASMNCLRRAINWHPGHVHAYVLASSILLGCSDDPYASCQIMEMLLHHFGSREAETIRTVHFNHCSGINGTATVWETQVAGRYVVGASVLGFGILAFATATRGKSQQIK